jgi:APA family basic amino acid/polyamine antiporter
MAEATMGSRPTLFLRNATGLVKAWSTFDAFIYSFMSVNLVTLALYYGTASGWFAPTGNMLEAVIITGVAVTFLVVVYAGLVTAMPRTGGDYAWQSRVLGGGVAFVLAVTGWWFILWYWTPIYGNILVAEFINPLAATLGWTNVTSFFSSQWGIFVACLLTLAYVSVVVTLGMETYARIQKVSFWLGVAGIAVVCVLLLISSNSDFQNAFNREATSLFGAKDGAYQATIDAGNKSAGATLPGLNTFDTGATLLIIPLLLFALLWPNWGATLYGEVRGAKEYRRPFYSMFWGLWVTVALVILLVVLINKTMTWSFYNAANAASFAGTAPVTIWPNPIMFAGWLVDSHVFQVILLLVMGAWFFGWAGTLFLSSTRVIFAAAFDRVLPAWAANISAGRRVPYGALVLMVVPSIAVSALYAWNAFADSSGNNGFRTFILDAALVIAITFLGTVVAAAILPWRRKDIYDSSPIARYNVAGIPALTIASVITGAFLVWTLFQWFSNSLFGVNNRTSLYFMGAMYILAIVIYVLAFYVRRRQGIDLNRIHEAIPVE